MLSDILLIGTGAFVGANLRYWVTERFSTWFGPGFPYGTLFINISGSFVLGFVLTFSGGRLDVDQNLRLLLGTGLLGGYTTFSAFSYETIVLLERGDFLPATWNVVLSVLGSLVAAYAGISLARVFA